MLPYNILQSSSLSYIYTIRTWSPECSAADKLPQQIINFEVTAIKWIRFWEVVGIAAFLARDVCLLRLYGTIRFVTHSESAKPYRHAFSNLPHQRTTWCLQIKLHWQPYLEWSYYCSWGRCLGNANSNFTHGCFTVTFRVVSPSHLTIQLVWTHQMLNGEQSDWNEGSLQGRV
jgi:hypothetical protein